MTRPRLYPPPKEASVVSVSTSAELTGPIDPPLPRLYRTADKGYLPILPATATAATPTEETPQP